MVKRDDGPNIFGYFDSVEQETPAFDPGFDVPCPVCLRQLSRPAVAISLLPVGGNKSYFFRAHKNCWGSASEETKSRIEGSIIDADVAASTNESKP